MPAELDHLVLVSPDLDEAVRDLAARTGVEPVPGGSHPGRGSRNALLGLRWRGGRRSYLELLAPDPDQTGVPPSSTMLDLAAALRRLDGPAPRTHTWAVRPDGLDRTLARAGRAGVGTGEAVAASRVTPSGARLRWRLAVPQPLGLGGVQPFLIDWGDGPHPSEEAMPTLELVALALEHPQPRRAAQALAALGVDEPVGRGPRPRLRITLDTPRGLVVLD